MPGMALPYNPALDGLRAIAVLAVVEYHSEWHIGYGWKGVLGVDVFFVLSGFLITSILLQEEARGGIRLLDFYVRRARRLYPALAVLVAAMMAVGWVHWTGALNALLYLGDYFAPAGALSHTWSLAVEEHYYLLWPLLLPMLARMKRSHAIWLLGAVYAASWAWAELNTWGWRESFRFDTRMSGLVLGSLLAFLPRDSKLPFALLAGVSVALMLGYTHQRPFVEAVTACVILLSYQTTIPFLTRSPFVYIGKISYGIYLYHWPVTFALKKPLDGMEHLIATAAISIGLAALSFHTVEAWFRNKPSREPAMSPALS